MNERLALSIPEAADALGISRNHAYLLAKQGKLPTVKFGKRILVPVAALEKWLSLPNRYLEPQES